MGVQIEWDHPGRSRADAEGSAFHAAQGAALAGARACPRHGGLLSPTKGLEDFLLEPFYLKIAKFTCRFGSTWVNLDEFGSIFGSIWVNLGLFFFIDFLSLHPLKGRECSAEEKTAKKCSKLTPTRKRSDTIPPLYF